MNIFPLKILAAFPNCGLLEFFELLLKFSLKKKLNKIFPKECRITFCIFKSSKVSLKEVDFLKEL